jgi:hypothetical protein
MKSLQKFASVHANFHNHFDTQRHLVNRQTFKAARSAALAEWQNSRLETGVSFASPAPSGAELPLD